MKARQLLDSLLAEDGFPIAQAYGAARLARNSDKAKNRGKAPRGKKPHLSKMFPGRTKS